MLPHAPGPNDSRRALDSARLSPAEPPPPKLLRYAVIAGGGAWRVLSGRAQIGRYPTRGAAMAVAVNLTRQALESGHAAELYAQSDDGDFMLHPLFPPQTGA